MLTEPLNERLRWFKDGLCIATDSTFAIEETKAGGEGKVIFHPRSLVVAVNGLEGRNLYCLNNLSCADGILFERITDDSWRLHIIELKATIKRKSWEHAKAQFEGAILNAYALIGVLGIPKIAEIKCYIAYQKDEFRPREGTNPTSYKIPFGTEAKKSPYIEWSKQEKLNLLSLEIEYIKIPMNHETKEGVVNL